MVFWRRLDPSCTAEQFWNYLRRQLYVMDTYYNTHNRSLNHTMLALHGYLSWAFIVPFVLTVLELIADGLPTWAMPQVRSSTVINVYVQGPTS